MSELIQTFIEETLDVPPSEKSNLTVAAITRQIAVKFPELIRDTD
jgi:hypothetical protein